jgi:hypothetical protein
VAEGASPKLGFVRGGEPAGVGEAPAVGDTGDGLDVRVGGKLPKVFRAWGMAVVVSVSLGLTAAQTAFIGVLPAPKPPLVQRSFRGCGPAVGVGKWEL